MCESCGCGDSNLVPVEVHARLLERNEHVAAHNREHFARHGIVAINLMRLMSDSATLLAAATIGLLLAFGSVDACAGEEYGQSLGRQLFIARCASCHGADGRGFGPAADALKTAPADLTQLSRTHNGRFPYFYVVDVIDGERLRHGGRGMPAWGREFRWQSGEYGARAQIYALTQYVESIQEK